MPDLKLSQSCNKTPSEVFPQSSDCRETQYSLSPEVRRCMRIFARVTTRCERLAQMSVGWTDMLKRCHETSWSHANYVIAPHTYCGPQHTRRSVKFLSTRCVKERTHSLNMMEKNSQNGLRPWDMYASLWSLCAKDLAEKCQEPPRLCVLPLWGSCQTCDCYLRPIG